MAIEIDVNLGGADSEDGATKLQLYSLHVNAAGILYAEEGREFLLFKCN